MKAIRFIPLVAALALLVHSDTANAVGKEKAALVVMHAVADAQQTSGKTVQCGSQSACQKLIPAKTWDRVSQHQVRVSARTLPADRYGKNARLFTVTITAENGDSVIKSFISIIGS